MSGRPMDEIRRLVGEFGNANFDCGAHNSSTDDESYETVLARSHAAREALVAAVERHIVDQPAGRVYEEWTVRDNRITKDSDIWAGERRIACAVPTVVAESIVAEHNGDRRLVTADKSGGPGA